MRIQHKQYQCLIETSLRRAILA